MHIDQPALGRPRPGALAGSAPVKQASIPAARQPGPPDPASSVAKVQPHPLTPERKALAAQHRLFGAVETALAANDFSEARQLLRDHRSEFAKEPGWHEIREAFELLADCREHPSPEASARGARFVAEQRGSTMRRRVRRACLHGVARRPRSPH